MHFFHHSKQPESGKEMDATTNHEHPITPSESSEGLVQTTEHSPEAECNDPKESACKKFMFERFKEEHARRKAIHDNFYDNGPYEFVFNQKLGKEILQRNPDWPYKGSRELENRGLSVAKEDEDKPDFVKQQLGTWKQTSDSSAQFYFNGYSKI